MGYHKIYDAYYNINGDDSFIRRLNYNVYRVKIYYLSTGSVKVIIMRKTVTCCIVSKNDSPTSSANTPLVGLVKVLVYVLYVVGIVN